MAPKQVKQEAIDRRLEAAADDPERFEALADALIEELDRKRQDVEIRHPSHWRDGRPAGTARTSFLNQFRADVERITILDRVEEGRLARRIELTRRRLERARKRAGVEGSVDPLVGLGIPAADDAMYDAPPSGKPGSEQELARRAIELHALRVEMVERNLYLVLINVERYVHGGVSRVDLIQEGSLSLFRAVDGFDWRRGLLFRTYAVHWLNQAFRNYLYNFGHTVRVPVYLQKALKHINQAQIQLGDPHASVDEIAETADLPENLVATAMSAARASFSIDGGSDDEGSSRLRDVLVDADEGPYSTRLESLTLEEGLEKALGRLSDREELVVSLRFGIGQPREHTLAEVAEQLGVSVERVRQIQVRALAKLNTPNLRRELDPWLN